MSEKITLKELAEILDRHVQEVYEMAKEANAIILVPGESGINIDLDKFKDYLDTRINEEVAILNNRLSEFIEMGGVKYG